VRKIKMFEISNKPIPFSRFNIDGLLLCLCSVSATYYTTPAG
jgi:hypothetical protein